MDKDERRFVSFIAGFSVSIMSALIGILISRQMSLLSTTLLSIASIILGISTSLTILTILVRRALIDEGQHNPFPDQEW